ncbi:MAG: 3-deoxy-D-manno-octulosonic acid transferase [Luteolibacter sp.]
MKERAILLIYRALLPLLFIIAFPGWIIKMLRRGGFGTGLHERVGIFTSASDFEPCGSVHLHAVSVGETILALKLLKAWQAEYPDTRFVLATGTSTGHDTATRANIPNLRVTYVPLDFPWMVKSYLSRFEPSQIVLIEGEVWPNLLRIAQKRAITVSLANARTSPRSARRFQKLSPILRPFFSRLSAVCIQEKEHRTLWEALGINPENIHLTGSIKFDPGSTSPPAPRADFAEILASFGSGRPIILAASTFPGEEALLASAIVAALPEALPVIVPRHAERRAEVSKTLTKAGFQPILRSNFCPPTPGKNNILVIDTTGELATWTAHADTVIIGKSFLSTGGQNPAEAIISGKPLILGPHMENFQPLCSQLLSGDGAITASTPEEISTAIRDTLHPDRAKTLTENANHVLAIHQGATSRHLKVLHRNA